MIRRLPPGELDRATLSRRFGFPVPVAFVEFMRVLGEQSSARGQDCTELFYELTGLYLAGEEARYQQTPPEMFPIAAMGVDGVHYGYVIHAPELSAADYPIGDLCPMDAEGVALLGTNTLEAIETQVAWHGSLGDAELEGILPICRALGITPDPQKAGRWHDDSGNGLPIRPRTAPGWQYIPSADGIGVLAPSVAFRTGDEAKLGIDTTAEEYLHLADKANADGFPASALLSLREGYWCYWTDYEVAREFSTRLMATYSQLGRPLLALVTERRMSHLSKLAKMERYSA